MEQKVESEKSAETKPKKPLWKRIVKGLLWFLGGTLVFFQHAQYVDAVHAGHAEIEHHEIGVVLSNPRQAFRAGFDGRHFRFVFERAGNHHQVDVVVVDGEQMRRSSAVKGICHRESSFQSQRFS